MGRPGHEAGRADDEKPVHEVRLDPFALGKYEVTVGEFRTFVKAAGYRTDAEKGAGGNAGCFTVDGDGFGWIAGTSWRAPGIRQGDDHPVVCVSWNDARAYVQWLARTTGKAFRLPSEAELEYAIRAGSTGPYAWPSGASQCDHANAADQALRRRYADEDWTVASCSDRHVYTAPVGQFEENAFGLADTVGNVWEWAEDCWHDSYAAAPTDGRAWTRGGDCSRRVVRGGSWRYNPGGLHSANRGRRATTGRSNFLGFRVALDLHDPAIADVF